MDAPRNYRLRPDINAALATLRERLVRMVKYGHMTADGATKIYTDMLATTVRDTAAMILDDREWSPVRCRRCGRPGSVPSGDVAYSCRCTPNVKRFLARDLVGPDGSYAVDPDTLPTNS